MGKMKKKYSSGMAKTYMSRNKAIRVLQLSLADFRRLCILKGIYPVEPRSLKKATKGAPKVRTFFLAQDIKFLKHEPIIDTFRQLKIYSRKLKKFKYRNDTFQFERMERTGKPPLTLNHIILERYPKFGDALGDLDDCLCLVILYATYPMNEMVDPQNIITCRRLIVEFMNYVMITGSLRKCFISIKGFYFQANLGGHDITWIMPHQVGYTKPFEVDLKIMNTFLEFYIQMLGFVVFKLYNDGRFVYPPKFEFTADTNLEKMVSQTEFFQEMLSSFNMKPERLTTNAVDAEKEEDFNEAIPSADLDALPILQQLDDPCITHHIIDRPIDYSSRVIGRNYVQPQWVFDSINFRRLQPTQAYEPGVQPPSHFSPFVNERPGDYVSKDKLRMMGLSDDEIDNVVKENEQGPSATMVVDMSVEERKLRETMIPKKLKRIYTKAVHSAKREKGKNIALKEKKNSIEQKAHRAKPNMDKKRQRKRKNRIARLAQREQGKKVSQ